MNDTSPNSSIIRHYTSTDTDVFFAYEVKLSQSELFDHPPFSLMFKQIGEMIITSDNFAEYEECVQDCYEMLNVYAQKLKTINRGTCDYIIATKINPLHDPAHDGSKVSEQWTEDMVLKLYLAEAAPLKEEKVIKSTISATILVTQEVDVRSASATSLIN